MPHPNRDDIYINQIITPHNQIKKSEKTLVNRILLKEVVRRTVKIAN